MEKRYYGNYRALVVDNRDPSYYGRIKVWIPDLMPDIDKQYGIWAFSANNQVGGRNNENENSSYSGTSYIPRIGSYVWIFFEAGIPSRPFYFGSLEVATSKTLPEVQTGTNYSDKWVILKSKSGRCIVVSDDVDDERVEITGKKRLIKDPPEGDIESVFKIDDNQTTILLDERSGKEKLLIRTHKGDFININIEERKLDISFYGDINLKSNSSINIQALDDINIKASGDLNTQQGGSFNQRSNGNSKMASSSDVNIKSSKKVKIESNEKMSLKSNDSMSLESNNYMNIIGSMIHTNGLVGVCPEGGSIIFGYYGISPETADNSEIPNETEDSNPEGERD